MAKTSVLLPKEQVIDELIQEVARLLGDDVTIETTVVTKTNVEKEGIIIKTSGCNIAPTIYLAEFVNMIEADASNITTIAEKIVEIYENSRIDEDLDINWFTQFQSIKPHLFMKLLNTEMNQKLLADVPSISFLDLSIVFFVKVPNMDNATILIHNNHLAMWGDVSVDTLFEIAKENTLDEGYEIESLASIISRTMGLPEDEIFNFSDDSLYVLTNKDKINGSILFSLESVLSKFVLDIEEKDGRKISSVYILPSSVHESILLIHDSDTCIQEMKLSEMIASVNESELAPEEVLSGHPYCYLVDQHKIISID